MRENNITPSAYDRFMYLIERRYLRKRRARLISGLTGRILEVGVGTGVNFEHYTEEAEVTAIEPSPDMMEWARRRRDVLLLPNRITLHEVGCGYPEMEQLVNPASLDAVVCTLVLCTIPDPARALENFNKWLKPGGRLVVIEHIRSRRRLFGKIQDLMNPLWSRMADGCQLNRRTDEVLKSLGFELLHEERFNVGLPFYLAEYRKPGVLVEIFE